MGSYKIFGQKIDKLEYKVPSNKTAIFSKITAHNTSYTSDLSVSVGESIDFNFVSVDPSFKLHDFTYSGSVRASVVQDDNKVIVCGFFTNISGVSRSYVARFHDNGDIDYGFNPQPNSGLRTLAIQPDGKIIIAGDFSNLGGTAMSKIARLNVDGTTDGSFIPPTFNNQIDTVAIQSDGKILVGGNFTTVGGTVRTYFARLNSDGSLDTSFNMYNINGFVNVIKLQSDGKILVGGQFSIFLGNAINKLARVNPDGTLDASINFPLYDGQVRDILIQDDGTILAFGDFSQVGSRIAKINTNNTMEAFSSSIFSSSIYSSSIETAAFQSDGKILVGGYFTEIDGSPHQCLARFNPDGTHDTSFVSSIAGQPSLPGSIDCISVLSNDKFFIGGPFTVVGGTSAEYFCKITTMPKYNKMYLIKNKEVLFDEKIEISGGIALEDGEMLLVQTLSGEEFIIDAYGVEV